MRKGTQSLIMGVLATIVAVAVVLPALNISVPGLAGTPSQTQITVEMPATEPGQVPEEQRGTAYSGAIDVYDTESDSGAELSSVPLGVYLTDGTKVQDQDTFNTSATFEGVDVGDEINIYGGTNGSTPVYIDALSGYTITSQSKPIRMDGATGAQESEIQITCYDSDDNEFVTGGNTNHSFPDYNISLGSSAVEELTCKIKVNAADNAYDLKGICLGYINDVNDFEFDGEVETYTDNPSSGGSWAKAVMPEHVSDTALTDGNLGSEYDTCYERDEVLRLSEWDWVKLKFTMEASSTGCAEVAVGTPSNSTVDHAFFVTKDAAWGEDTLGNMVYGIADGSNTELDVGLDETDDSPNGGETGAGWYCA